MALPSNITFGTVTGTFIRGVADSPADPDRDPEAQPVTDLTVKFTPSISPSIVRDTSTSPPITLLIDPVTCTVNSSGTLIGPDGAAGVKLIASTGAALSPSGWTWTVAISSTTFPELAFAFALDAGATVDLATVVQVPASPGATLAAWLQAVAQAQAAAATAVPFGATPPDHTKVTVWADTSVVPPVLKGWNGSVWVPIGGGTVSYTPLAVDSDGVYYYTAGASLALDSDGVPYYTSIPDSSSKSVLIDTDGVYYYA